MKPRTALSSAALWAVVVSLATAAVLAWGLWRDGRGLLQHSRMEDGYPAGLHARGHRLLLPSPDAAQWVVQQEAMRGQGEWRLRWTAEDNAPHGRPVEWSSPPRWLLAAGAAVADRLRVFDDLKPAEAATLCLGPLALLLFVAGAGLAVGRLWGSWAAIGTGLGILGSVTLRENFAAGGFDHHLLVAICSFGCLLGFVAGVEGPGAGDGRSGRRWLTFSALAGAVGLWISAISTIPLLAAIGVAVVAGRGGEAKGRSRIVDDFIFWCRVGAAASLVAYLVEYAPALLRLRLEANHPAYALAWLGAGEVVAGLLQPGRARGRRLVLGLGGLAVAPAMVLLNGTDSYLLLDPLLRQLHREALLEFRGLFALVADPRVEFSAWRLSFVAVACGWGVWRTVRVRSAALDVVQLSLVPTLVCLALALVQVRWLLSAESCALVLIAALTGTAAGSRFRVWSAVTAFAAALAVALAGTSGGAAFTKTHAVQLAERGLARTLANRSANGAPLCLAGPRLTTHLMFFGGARGLGTLYWENKPGLERAARIYAATDADEAFSLLRTAGVDYLVVTSWDDFESDYVRLARGRGQSEQRESYLRRALRSGEGPVWLRPVVLPLPDSALLAGERWEIFEFMPDRSAVRALQERCELLIERREFAALAERVEQLRQQAAADLPSRITLARTFMVLGRPGQAAGVGETLFRSTPEQASLDAENGVRLTGVLAALRRSDLAQVQFDRLTAQLSARDIACFPPDVLNDLAALARVLDTPPESRRLIERFAPGVGR
jgi:hypothetical protein